MAQVVFDGNNKVILVEAGVKFIDVQRDIYSEWKRWIVHPQNKKFTRAIRVVGGDSLPVDNLGSTFFLMNGWKIKPYEGDHRLTIDGNIYAMDGSDIIKDTDGNFKVSIMMTVSNIINKVLPTSGGLPPVVCDSESSNINNEDGWTVSIS